MPLESIKPDQPSWFCLSTAIGSGPSRVCQGPSQGSALSSLQSPKGFWRFYEPSQRGPEGAGLEACQEFFPEFTSHFANDNIR